MTPEEIQKMLWSQPTQWIKEKDDLSLLCDRWVGLIRNHGFKLVKDQQDNKMTSPDLFDIANEIESFFQGLKARK